MEFLSFSDLLDQYKYKGKAIEIQTEISNANSKTVSPKVRYVSPCFPRKRDKYTTVIPRKKKIDNETKTTAITKKRNCRKTKKRRCLSKHELFMEAYRRKTVDNTWKPPKSPYGLLQEKHAHDPWRVLVICKLLNVTSGPQLRDSGPLTNTPMHCKLATLLWNNVVRIIGEHLDCLIALENLCPRFDVNFL